MCSSILMRFAEGTSVLRSTARRTPDFGEFAARFASYNGCKGGEFANCCWQFDPERAELF